MQLPFVHNLLLGLLALGATVAYVRAESVSTPPAPGKTISVRENGAKGDGITDDAPAINDAVQRAKALGPGSAVYVPAGLDRTDYYFTQRTIDSVNKEAKTLDVTIDPGYPAPDGVSMAANRLPGIEVKQTD